MPKTTFQSDPAEKESTSSEDKIRGRLVSEEGRRKFEEALKASDDLLERFRRARRIDAKLLRQPMTM